MKDEEVWAGVKAGDYSALKELYSRYFQYLYSYGLKMAGDSESAEDAIHDLFVDLWKYKERLSDTTSIRFYLFRALRRKLYKNRQTKTRDLIPPEDFAYLEDKSSIPNEDLILQQEESSETKKKLASGINDLPLRQKEAVMLRFFGDMSYREIGKLMDINEQSARNLVQRGLEHMRKFIGIIIQIIIFIALGSS